MMIGICLACSLQHFLGERLRPAQRRCGPSGRIGRVRTGETRREDGRLPRRVDQRARRAWTQHHRYPFVAAFSSRSSGAGFDFGGFRRILEAFQRFQGQSTKRNNIFTNRNGCRSGCWIGETGHLRQDDHRRRRCSTRQTHPGPVHLIHSVTSVDAKSYFSSNWLD